MTFAYTGGAENGGNSATASTGVHGITINSGDLVVVYVNSNSETAISADAGGTAFNEAIDEKPLDETSRQALYWKVAGVSEPTAYTFTVGSAEWHVLIKVFTSASDAVVDAAANSARNGSSAEDLLCTAGSGQTVSDDAVSIVAGGKDNRSGSPVTYDGADSSYVSPIGDTGDQAAGMAHRIWTTGGSEAATISVTATGGDGITDNTYSVHISFVESSTGTINNKTLTSTIVASDGSPIQ